MENIYTVIELKQPGSKINCRYFNGEIGYTTHYVGLPLNGGGIKWLNDKDSLS